MDPEVSLESRASANDAVFDRTSGSLCLDQPATSVSQVSPARAKALAAMGIATVRDLLSNYPRRYIDLSKTATVAEAKTGRAARSRGASTR